MAQSFNINGISPQDAVNALIGNHPSVHAFNATFTGVGGQLAGFSNTGGNFPVTQGIALTTGYASFASSKNTSNQGDQSPVPDQNIYDTSLQSLMLGSQKGTCFLEFDVKFEGQTFSLNYAFASDEYNVYAASEFHDQMGIFIIGPGIFVGENIAKIGTDHVSVNTVNGCTNSSYYQNNCRYNPNSSVGGPQCAGSCNAPTLQDFNIPYNGFTKKMTATYTLPTCNPNAIYHMKIAICNIGDNQYDSGVFLEANSFACNFEFKGITATPQPVCNGSNVILQMNIVYPTGSDPTVVWSNGHTGSSSTTVIADINNTFYSSTMSLGNCTITKSINVIVHTNQNTAPFTNGINNTGDYSIFIPANQTGCANIPSFDSPNENVVISSNNNQLGSTFQSNFIGQEIGTFCWAPSMGQVGIYNFNVQTTDNNVCGQLSNSQTYEVKAVCKNCNIDVYYENRSPSNNPLPLFTKAGRSITAGNSVDANQTDGDVYASTTNATEFKAGKKITLAAGFHSSSQFWAHLDPTTCINDCNDCCDYSTGLHLFVYSWSFSPNNDGINDYWQVIDPDNVNCAYGIKSYNLTIYAGAAGTGNVIYQVSGGDGSTCCQFNSAPYPNPNNIVSSINWNGYKNNGTKCIDGYYAYELNVEGCGVSKGYAGYIRILGGSQRLGKDSSQASNVNVDSLTFYNHPITPGNRELSSIETVNNTNTLNLFPNPANNNVSCFFTANAINNGTDTGTLSIQNIVGSTLKTLPIAPNKMIDVNIKDLPEGTYLIQVIYNYSVFNSTLMIVH